MWEGAKNIKVVSYTTIAPPPGFSACQSCGDTRHSGGVCRRCALRLVDVALDSESDPWSEVAGPDSDQPTEAPASPPRWYDHYELCLTPEGNAFELGRGAMGITYKAIDSHLGCPVALKVINAEYLLGRSGRDRFLREARTAARLKHPNIASIHHLGLGEDEHCFYAMEYIEGITLEAWVQRNGPFSCEEALDIAAQAARALRTAHRQDFIHRDIKPTNIMLVDGGHTSDDGILAKVIDFGLVKALATEIEPGDLDLLSLGYFAGTPGYASPEQRSGGRVDARSDIYALGMCLRFMLTGTKPPLFPETEEVIGHRRFCTSRAPDSRLEKTPVSVRTLVQSITEADCTRRLQNMDVVLQHMERCTAEVQWVSGHQGHRGQIPRWKLVVTTLIVCLAACWVGGPWHFKPAPVVSPHTSMSMKTDPHLDARVLYAQANDQLARHTKLDTEHSIELLSKAVALTPDYADAHAALAMAYFQAACRFGAPASQLELAVGSAQHAMALNPASAKGYSVMALIRSWQNKHWEALGLLHQALELDPRYVPAMRNFSVLWCMVGRPQLGLPWAEAAARLEPSDPFGWNAAGDLCVDLCADEQAQEFYRRCLQINPGWIPAHCGLLHVHLLQGDFERARQDFALTESIEPGLVLPLTLKGQIELFSGNVAEAEAIYRRLLTMNRNGCVSYYGGISYLSALGYLRLRAGDPAEGDALLAEAAQLHLSGSEGPQGIYDLAAVRALQGQKEDALRLLGQAITSGWMDYRVTQLDPRFFSLRSEARFQRLLEDLAVHVSQMHRVADGLRAKPLKMADYPVDSSR